MPLSTHRAALVGGSADEVEASFYDALQRGDIEALMACWADEDDVICVHPGAPRLIGVAAIRESFEGMFGHGAIHATVDRVRKIESVASAVHNLIERIEVMTDEGARHAYVVATNVYMKTAQGWRLVAHHASPGTPREPQDRADSLPQTLH
ncbi:MAG: DUF4440 domain-containing protein [Comamonadaceae bacterium]|nr:MAG: DUF4440 domain-containing protein [Comamonadaceae bacterium]